MKSLYKNFTQNIWVFFSLIVILIILSPILIIFYSSFNFNFYNWNHLLSTKLNIYIINTITLLFGVGFCSLLLGLTTAWIIVRYDFLFSKILEWALLLPAAIPAYIVAYCYTDFLDFSGPLQTFIRDIFLLENKSDYYFPNIRSMEGTILVMSFVLYPYVYFLSKVSFLSTPVSLYELAKLRGNSIFINVALPIARPAIIGGFSLVLMETISDFGTVEFFAIETITLGIFNLWLGMNDFNSATQLALLSFTFIVILLTIELISRNKKRYDDTNIKSISNFKIKLSQGKSLFPIFICLIPLTFGFILPVTILINQSISSFDINNYDVLINIFINTIFVGGISSFLIIFIGILLSLTINYKNHNNYLKFLAIIAGSGYAFPGVIIALGTTYVFSSLQNIPLLENFLIVGSIFSLIIAYIARFNAIGFNSINSGILRLPRNIVEASLTLNTSFEKTTFKIILPLIKPSILIGALLSFVDIVKELPITLILRPFNFETLATYSYQFAKDEMFEQSALSSLLIVFVGIIPIILLNLILKPEKFLYK